METTSKTGPDEETWLDEVAFDSAGLVPVIAQSVEDGRVLMLAWADRAALAATRRSGLATYYSRSRARQWRKGEESGHTQRVREIRLDCDGDALLYLVEQEGGVACHTGRASCFFRDLRSGAWTLTDAPPALAHAGAGRT
jgi:phosphoribosyl-AMP cyclohydrolase